MILLFVKKKILINKERLILVAQKCLKQLIYEAIIRIFQIRDETECRVFLWSKDVERFFSGQDRDTADL